VKLSVALIIVFLDFAQPLSLPHQHSALIRPVYGRFAPISGYFQITFHKAVTVTFSLCNLPILFHFVTTHQVPVPLVTYYLGLRCITLRPPSNT